MSDTLRLDAALVSRSLAGGRDKAKALIEQGHVFVNGKAVTKPSYKVSEQDVIVCNVQPRFVGRGGEKLQKVLGDAALTVQGCRCVDIGASTGGFTDCMLQYGAQKVYAVDVGHDQLAQSLRLDPRVVCLEGVDIRRYELVLEHMGGSMADVCTVDVSFISLTQIWDAVVRLMKADGCAVCLIKPQFEAGRQALGKRGVVKSPKDHVRVLQSLLSFWRKQGFGCSYLSWSPIKGGEGNIEYIAVLSQNCKTAIPAVSDVVAQAFAQL